MVDPLLGASTPLVHPLYASSVYRLADLDALDLISNGAEPGFIYARDAHPNSRLLAEKLTALEGANWSLVCASGMGALSLACLGILKSGDRVIASNQLYGRSSQLLKQELSRFNVSTEFVDVNQLDTVEAAFRQKTSLMIVETISNPLLRVADSPALADIAHRHDCRLLVDNTFATPVLFRPLEQGADLVMESLTKMIGGHSDVTLGVLCGREERLYPELTQKVSIWGLTPSPHECWLTERSISTLRLRMRSATENAAIIARWLVDRQLVKRVIHPVLPDHPDHEIAKRLLADGCGNMLSIELFGDGRESVNRFMRQASGIAFCPSLGDVSTTCSHPATTSHRYVSPEEKSRQGITNGLIRLSIGVEPVETIQCELMKGL